MNRLCKGDMFLSSAFDCALWDLYGKKLNRSLADLWQFDKKSIPLSNYTLSIGKTSELIAQVEELDWPIYKLKLGRGSEIESLRKLRAKSDAAIRVDVNGGWDITQLIQYEPVLREIGVEYIEQPLKPEDDHNLLHYSGHLPVMADESFQVLEDMDHCAQFYDGINIKLMKCGGITKALEILKKAEKLGLMVMGGCMSESSIGLSCLAQLAPRLDFIDLDSTSLINNDPAKGVVIKQGLITLPDGPGTGAYLP